MASLAEEKCTLALGDGWSGSQERTAKTTTEKKTQGVQNEHEPIMSLLIDSVILLYRRLRVFLGCHPGPLKTIGAGVGEAGG